MKIDELINEHLYSDNSSDCYPEFFHIISGGRHTCAAPDSFETLHFPYYFLLYTNTDSLSLSLTSREREPWIQKLSSNSLTLLLPSTSFHLDILTPRTDFLFLVFDGKNADYYFSEDVKEKGYLYLEQYPTSLLSSFHPIFTSFYQESCAILHHRCLTDFLTDCFFLQTNSPVSDTTGVPNYLLELKHYLNQFYMEPITLKQLEEQSGYSQYRICRDFSNYFNTSPLQYLNQLRIEKAKKILISSDAPIHEVGSMVGIENTTHFINLFKRQEGVTPLVYRQQFPVN